MSDLTETSAAVRLCAAYYGRPFDKAVAYLKQSGMDREDWRDVATEHERLVAEDVKAARVQALEEALNALPEEDNFVSCAAIQALIDANKEVAQ